MSAALTAPERRDLDTLGGVVQRGIDTFVEVGRALAEIRDRKLYRASHGTFEEYAGERWLLSRTRAYQMIDAAAVSTIVDSDPPANEAQARELAPFGPRGRGCSAWREAKAGAEELGNPLTARVIRNAVQKRLGWVKREAQHEELTEQFMDSRCDGCGRTPRELGQGPGLGWFWSSRNGVRTHLCGDCNAERMRQDQEREEREERELAQQLGDDGYRLLQEERARRERCARASKR